jgi:hypothetical protein
MSINSVPSNELAAQRKLVSDKKDADPALSIPSSSSNNPRSAAYQKTRGIQSDNEIDKIANQTDEDYFNELLDW